MLQERPALPAGCSLRQPALPLRQVRRRLAPWRRRVRVSLSAPRPQRQRGFCLRSPSGSPAPAPGIAWSAGFPLQGPAVPRVQCGSAPGLTVMPRGSQPHLLGLPQRRVACCGSEYSASQRRQSLRYCASGSNTDPDCRTRLRAPRSARWLRQRRSGARPQRCHLPLPAPGRLARSRPARCPAYSGAGW